MTTSTSHYSPIAVWNVPDQFKNIYSHAVEIPAGKRLLFVSGQIGIAPDGTIKSGFLEQCEQAMDNVEALLSAAEMSKVNIVKITYFLTRVEDQPDLGEVRRQRWASAEPPSVTTVVVAALARPEYLIEIEVIAAAL
jgi:2-iminobutanoate/2-iminopropanoate deaminase